MSGESAYETTHGAPALADAIVAAVLAIPGVADMHAGAFGEAATHLSGRRVVGVQIRDDHVEVHVSLYWDADLPPTADLIRAAATRIAQRPVHIVVEDVTDRPRPVAPLQRQP